ncbi:hypothetical protein [Acidianus brierleyi]|uniref:Uncharacterized protein n=1 Tax=Acidianus brierleyi TaxID=41673 RepID=A0A2U9IIT8_9CREN|nr:hypothetical protein [Acidianus brierleyi]AWR95940.1 hypothetical protein DFR85_07460 [Acidianus brierleyi]
MNSKIEAKIAQMRCENKPVKLIAKKLGINRDDIEAIIKKWINNTDDFLNDIIKNRKVKNPKADPGFIVNSIQDLEELLKNDDVLDYIAVHRSDYHDRLMDCIRYKIYRYLNKE